MAKIDVSEMDAPVYHDDHEQNGSATVGHWHSGPSGGAFEPSQITDLIEAEEAARIATDDALSRGIIQNKDDIDAVRAAGIEDYAKAKNTFAAILDDLEAAIQKNTDDIAALTTLFATTQQTNIAAHARKSDDTHEHYGYSKTEG